MEITSAHRSLAVGVCAAALALISVADARDPADWRPTAEGLRSMAEYFPFETVENGGAPHALQWGEPIGQSGPEGLDLDAFNRENLSTGMIVLHKGRIVYEGYWQGADRESHFTSHSMAKSVTSTLIGIAESEGLIRALDDPIVRYVPELAETAYRDVTIEQALQMSSGVRFNENYVDPANDVYELLCLMLPPGPLFVDCDDVTARFGDVDGLLLSLDEQAATPGTKFNYSTAEAQVLGWVLRNAIGRSPAEYLSEKIWQPLGMEDDATWLLDRPGGTLLTSGSLSARLRDFARFGVLLLNDGVHEGRRLLPEGWVERATTPSKPHLKKVAPLVGYQYQWWILPNGAFEAQGAQGQFLRVDPEHELVVVKTSAWQATWDLDRALAFHAAVGAIVSALGYETD